MTNEMPRTPAFNSLLLEIIRKGYVQNHNWPARSEKPNPPDPCNPFRAFFDQRKEGLGIWKWDHYFEVYHRHFSRFRDREVHMLEIGIYSGGSLEMWREYFGPQARLYGVDIEPACKAYEGGPVKVLIGDQADRNFWQRFRQQVPTLDIVIDDGGHRTEQQIASFEELLPHLRPGGVYLCEDVHVAFNTFASYVHGVAHKLNDFAQGESNPDNQERRLVCKATAFQSAVQSIHLYPFVTVVERNVSPVIELIAPKRGTQWQPFLK